MKNTINDINSEQARRVLSILKLFLQYRVMTTNEVINHLFEQYGNVSKRSIQRDLSILRDEELIELDRKGAKSTWSCSVNINSDRYPIRIRNSEILSLYILKSYIGTFHNTVIESDIQSLTERLETLVPGRIFIENNFYADQNIGNYDYSDKNNIIIELIKHINEKNVIQIKYNRLYDNEIVDYTVYPEFLYTYSGTIYLVAYNPQRRKSISFAIQNIKSINYVETTFYLMRQFNFTEFQKERFAVFDGDLFDVKLLIKKDYAKYFKNRNWHISQKFEYDLDKNLILSLKVPLTPDFVAWIMQWNEAIIVMEPSQLKSKVIEQLKISLKNYNC